MTGGVIMQKVFINVELSDGRMISLEDLVSEYEELLNGESSKKIAISEPKADSQAVPKLEVGKWFRIDRNIIAENRDKIYRQCMKEGKLGKKMWQCMESANKIADREPDCYPRLIYVYIFDCKFNITEGAMQKMCKKVGDGMCDEVICFLELEMRICNGESTTYLFKKPDKLPLRRRIRFRNGEMGTEGGSAWSVDENYPPADLYRDYDEYDPDMMNWGNVTPYAFSRVPPKELNTASR